MPFTINRVLRNKINQAGGYSLIELTVVILILGIIAAVLVPDFSASNTIRMDAAAQQFAEAIRFSRSETLRTGKLHGFNLQPGNRRIRIASIDQNTSPWSMVYNVYHPVSKKLYDIDLNEQKVAGEVQLTRVTSFRGSCISTDNLYFDLTGSVMCVNPGNVPLTQAKLTFSLQAHTQVITLDGIAGRVTNQ